MFVSTDTMQAQVELSALPLPALEQRIEELAAGLAADTCRWLELLGEYDRRDGWETWGCLSLAHWVSWRCSVGLRAAREHVRVARALRELPAIRAAFRAGRLSYSKVRALTRVAEPASEEELVELAGQATASQLERLIRAYRRALPEEEKLAHERRHVSWSWEEDGSLSLHARLPAADGAAVVAAIEAEAEALRNERRAEREAELPQMGGDRCSAEHLGDASRADALTSICERRGSRDATPAERNLVCVHVDADALRSGPPAAPPPGRRRSHLRDGPSLTPDTARRIACDASVVEITEHAGEPLSVGRRRRTVPPALRRALIVRDEGCAFPGCTHRRYVDAHHIRHWADGGETSKDNLVLLCRRHHRLLHEEGYGLERLASGELVFRRPNGSPLASVPPPSSSPQRNRPPGAQAAGPLLTGYGERMDLDWAVMGLASVCSEAAAAADP